MLASLLFATVAIPLNHWSGRPLPAWPGAWPLVNILFVAPVLEELLFRGASWGYLRSAGVSTPRTVLLCSVGFALLHLPGWALASSGPLLVPIASVLLLGAARSWGHSLLAPMLLHAMNNAVDLEVWRFIP